MIDGVIMLSRETLGLDIVSAESTSSQKDGRQGRVKARAGLGAVTNAGPLQTYNQLTG